MRDYSGDGRHAEKGKMDLVKQRPINNAFVSDCLALRKGQLKNVGHISSSGQCFNEPPTQLNSVYLEGKITIVATFAYLQLSV